MTLPPRPVRAGRQRGWWFAGAALLVVLALGLTNVPGRTEEADSLSATVAVDATADTVARAREIARTDGQRRALAAIAERLASGTAPAKPPALDDKAITDLVLSFEVANERMSKVRYAADYTFYFRPEETRRLLQKAGAAADGSDKPAILIPVYQPAGQTAGQSRLWEDPNPWREAWEEQPPPGTAGAKGAARLVMPLGDAGDIAAIDADKARTGDPEALTAIARRNGGEEAIVVIAAMRGPPDRPEGLDAAVRRYRVGRPVDSHAEPLVANPGESESDLLRRAVAAIKSGVASGWKNEPVAHYDQEGSLTAVLPISGLDDWVRARERLAGVPAIRKIALVTLSRQEATIEIGYVGRIDQLTASLAEINLDLVRGDPLWRLARTGPARTP
jgi:Uncharacterized protein conserved in bacteria (DUF2066)